MGRGRGGGGRGLLGSFGGRWVWRSLGCDGMDSVGGHWTRPGKRLFDAVAHWLSARFAS